MMAKALDVYRDWLGISEATRPLNYYQLLRLKLFEDDPALVRAHYRKMNAHVRKFAVGEFQQQSQDLLNELAKAMLCLTDAQRKGEYDASLGREDKGAGRRWTVEELLIRRKVIDTEKLEKARRFSQTTGLDVHEAVIQQKLASPDVVMQVYAESLGLSYVDLAETDIDPELLAKVPAVIARQNSCVPVMVDDGQLLMASPQPMAPAVEDHLRLLFNQSVRSVLCTPAGVNGVINQYYPKEKAAAEMAGGFTAAKAVEKAAAASAAGGETAAARPTEPPPTLVLGPLTLPFAAGVALMAFNFGFMAVMLFLTTIRPMIMTRPPVGFGAALWPALGVALGAAATGFVGAKLLRR